MADDATPDESINRSDQVRHASDDARKAAMEKMRAALEAKEKGEEIQVESAGIEASKEDAAVSGGSNEQESQEAEIDSTTIKNVKVYSPFKVYYDAEAKSVSSASLTGPFDVLAGHKNFITLLTTGDVTIRSARGEEKISIERGIMHVREDNVTVFLDV